LQMRYCLMVQMKKTYHFSSMVGMTANVEALAKAGNSSTNVQHLHNAE